MFRPRLVSCLLLAFAAVAGVASAQSDFDPAKATLGKNLYRSYCSSCHGQDAKGDGPLAEVLTVKPTDLTLMTASHDGVFPTERTFQVIDGRKPVRGHGTADMPAWGDAFQAISTTEEEVKAKIGQLVDYLKSIQQ